MSIRSLQRIASSTLHRCHTARVSIGQGRKTGDSGQWTVRSREIFDLIAIHRGVTFFAAPTMVKRLVDYAQSHAVDTCHLKTIVYGGGPMYVADLKQAL